MGAGFGSGARPPRRRIRGGPVLLAVLLLIAATGCLPTSPPVRHWFGQPSDNPAPGRGNPDYPNWREDFPDPSVMVDNGTYYAYSTPTIAGGIYLPITTSTDLVNWRTHPPYAPSDGTGDRFFNDGMTRPASWGLTTNTTHPWLRKTVWAPHVAKFGNTYVDFYSIRVAGGSGDLGRFCISYATSSSPLGPFRDTTTGPLVCGDKAPNDPEPSDNPNGSTDSSVVFDAQGGAYLLWRNSGALIPGSNSRIYSRKLSATRGQWTPGFAAGSAPNHLAVTDNDSWWQGGNGLGRQIEAPSMVLFQGAYYLFYSGNHYWTANYATGFARCTTPAGPCTMWPNNADPQPLLTTANSGTTGPGGATAFVDVHGSLQLAYHHWSPGYVGYENGGQRFMRVVRLWPCGDRFCLA